MKFTCGVAVATVHLCRILAAPVSGIAFRASHRSRSYIAFRCHTKLPSPVYLRKSRSPVFWRSIRNKNEKIYRVGITDTLISLSIRNAFCHRMWTLCNTWLTVHGYMKRWKVKEMHEETERIGWQWKMHRWTLHCSSYSCDGGLSTELLINFAVSSAVQLLIWSLAVCSSLKSAHDIARPSLLGTSMKWKSSHGEKNRKNQKSEKK